mgnify:FL=1
MIITIPNTANKARKRILEIDTLENLGKWEKAAICYAFRAKHYDKIGDARQSAKVASDELNTNGYGEWTITEYANRWAGARLPDIRPGDDVEISGLPWNPVTGGNSVAVEKVTPSIAKNVVEAAKMDPEIAAVVYDKVAIEETVGANDERPDKIGREEDPVIKAFIEYEELKRILEQAIPLINIYRAKGEAIQELELVLDKVVEAIEAKKWDEAQWDEALNKLLNESSDEETS